jgi:membrane protease YdiL (CAAX protease family)
MDTAPRSRVATFLAIAFGFAYAVWIAAWVVYKVFHLIPLMGFMASTTVPMLGPALGVLVAKRLERRDRIKRGLAPATRVQKPRPERAADLRSALLYGAIGLAAVVAALLFSAVGVTALLTALSGQAVDWTRFPTLLVFWAAFVPIWIPLVFLEEIGWRYYVFNAWKGRGFLLAGVVLGIVWALWHLPTFFFYGAVWFNLALYLMYVPALHLLEAWVYVKGKSLLGPLVVHAGYNAFAVGTGASGFLFTGGQPYEAGATSMLIKLGANLAFLAALLPFAFLLARHLARPSIASGKPDVVRLGPAGEPS